jgi:hypothetical protein
MFYPYPGDLPTADVVQIVIDALRDKAVDVKAASHATWHVSGYALGKWDAHPPLGTVSDPDAGEVAGESDVQKAARRGFESGAGKAGRGAKGSATPPRELTRAQTADALAAVFSVRGADTTKALAIPWELLLPVLGQLLADLIKKWRGG